MKQTFAFIGANVPFILFSKRTKKALLPFEGDLSKNLFGTATMDDVNILKQHINELIKNSKGVKKIMKLQFQHFASFMANTDDRFDNIQQMVTDNPDSKLISKFSIRIYQTYWNVLLLFGRLINSTILQFQTCGQSAI